MEFRPEKLAQCLRALTLSEDFGSITSTHMADHSFV